MLKKIWKDPVGSEVIASIIISILGLVAVYIFGLWPLIKSWFSLAIEFLGDKSSVLNWVLILLVIPLLAVGWVSIMMLIGRFKKKVKNQRTYNNYVKDYFLGLNWHWDHGPYGIGNFHCLCPNCQFQIIPTQISGYEISERYQFKCSNCNYSTEPFEGSFKQLEENVKMKVQHKLRTGEWEKVLQSNEKLTK
jgi:hypothetical protein